MSTSDKAISTTPPQKFGFDTVFDEDGTVLSDAPENKRFSPTEIDAIKAAARADGEQQALARLEQEKLSLLTNVSATLNALAEQRQQAHALEREEFASLSYAIANKIAGVALDHWPRENIMQLIHSLWDEAVTPNPLTLFVHPEQVSATETDIQSAIKGTPEQRAGLVVQADPNLAPTDCRAVWPGGGIDMSQTELHKKIEHALGLETTQSAASPAPELISEPTTTQDSVAETPSEDLSNV